MIYGAKEWFEAKYAQSCGDPWGLDWRPSQQFRYQAMLKALGEVMPDSAAPERIFDVGCATGLFTALLRGIGRGGAARVTGIDVAESAVIRACARYPDIEFLALSLDECASRFQACADLVTCLEVLYYLVPERRQDALRKLKNMLRDGGVVLVSSMVARHPYMSPQELRDLVAGEFDVIRTGVLYLKPLALMEKAFMRIPPLIRRRREEGGNIARPHRLIGPQTVKRIAHVSQIFFGSYAQSHAYVLARRPYLA